jgi:hypothetical protein
MAQATQVDSMSLHEVIRGFDVSSRRALTRSGWSWRTSVELTTVLISAPSVRMAPAPAFIEDFADHDHRMQAALSNVQFDRPSAFRHRRAEEATRLWFLGSRDVLRNVFQSQLMGTERLETWLDWSARREWREHLLSHGSLLDGTFLDEIGYLVGMESRAELVRLYAVASRPDEVAALVRSNSDEARDIREAYAASAVLRGAFHQAVALSHNSVLHHPMRDMFLQEIESDNAVELEGDPIKILAGMLLLASFAEGSAGARLGRWLENVQRVVNACHSGAIRFPPIGPMPVEAAERMAVAWSETAGVQVHAHDAEIATDALVAGGVGLFTIFLQPLLALPAGVAAAVVTHAGDVDRRVPFEFRRHARLGDIARLSSGRIGRIWPR